MENVLRVTDLSKSYKKFMVLDSVSFEIGNGITALLGNNGAGKTTLINSIVGLIEPDKGIVELNKIDNGKSCREFRKHIGFLPQECGYYDNFTAMQFLKYIGSIKN